MAPYSSVAKDVKSLLYWTCDKMGLALSLPLLITESSGMYIVSSSLSEGTPCLPCIQYQRSDAPIWGPHPSVYT